MAITSWLSASSLCPSLFLIKLIDLSLFLFIRSTGALLFYFLFSFFFFSFETLVNHIYLLQLLKVTFWTSTKISLYNIISLCFHSRSIYSIFDYNFMYVFIYNLSLSLFFFFFWKFNFEILCIINHLFFVVNFVCFSLIWN